MSEDDKDHATRPYAVGYGKPPKGSRFQKGKSGNPSGRPRAVKGTDELLFDKLHSKVPALQEGKRKRVVLSEVLTNETMKLALKGDRHARKVVLDAEARVQAKREAQAHAIARELELDAQIYEAFTTRFGVEEDDTP